MKWLEYTLALCLIVFFLLGIALQTEFVRDYAHKTLIATIEKKTGFRAEIADLNLFPTFQFTAEGFALFDKENKLLETEYLSGGINPFQLLYKNLHFYQFELKNIQFFEKENPDPNIKIKGIKGNLFFNTQKKAFNAESEWVFENYAPFFVKGFLEDENGYIQIKGQKNISFIADFSISQETTWHLNRFHGSYESYILDGTATITSEGVFKESSILFTSGELAEKHPFKGYLYGEGKILGSLSSPELNLKVFSDELVIKETSFTDVQAKVLSHHSKKGLGGEISISFIKDKIPYEFSGRIYWEEKGGPFPSRFSAKTNLGDIAQIFNLDTTSLSGDVDIALFFSDKNIKGTAKVTKGQLESYVLGSLITEIEATIEGDLHKLTLTKLEAKDSEQGKYFAKGDMELDFSKDVPFNVSIFIDKARLIQLDNLTAITSGELLLKGDFNQAELSGSLMANNAILNIAEQSSSIAESIEIVYINHSPQEEPPTPYKIHRPDVPLNFHIKLNIPDNAVINGTSLSSVWKGEGLLTGTPGAPRIHGELNVVRGKYKLRGRFLEMHEGSIMFGGDLDKKISLYVIGEMNIDRYTIEVIVKGPVDNPIISFRSNPPLSRREILSWLLFNKDISDISEFQGNRLDQSMMTLSTNTDDGPDILTRIGDAVGIDRIDISGNTEAGGVSFELGKYVSDNTYISISRKPHGIGDSTRIGSGTQEQDEQNPSNRIGIETNLGRNFKLQAEVDEDQAGQINLIWKRDY